MNSLIQNRDLLHQQSTITLSQQEDVSKRTNIVGSLIFTGTSSQPTSIRNLFPIIDINAKNYKQLLKYHGGTLDSTNFSINTSNTFDHFEYLPTPLEITYDKSLFRSHSAFTIMSIFKYKNDKAFELELFPSDNTHFHLSLKQNPQSNLFSLRLTSSIVFDNLHLQLTDSSLPQSISISVFNKYSIKSTIQLFANNLFIAEYSIDDSNYQWNLNEKMTISGCDLINVSVFPTNISIADHVLQSDLQLHYHSIIPSLTIPYNDLDMNLTEMSNDYKVENSVAHFHLKSKNIIYNYVQQDKSLYILGPSKSQGGEFNIEFKYKKSRRPMVEFSLNVNINVSNELRDDLVGGFVKLVRGTVMNQQLHNTLMEHFEFEKDQDIWFIVEKQRLLLFLNQKRILDTTFESKLLVNTINILENLQNKIKIKKIRHFDRIITNLTI